MIISSNFPLKFFFKERQTGNFLYTQLGNIGWQKVTYLFLRVGWSLHAVLAALFHVSSSLFGDWKVLLRLVASCWRERKVKLKAAISRQHGACR